MNTYCWLAKRGEGFVPADDAACRLHRRMGDAECIAVRALRPRSAPWHRMYFALCRRIGRNQDPPRDEDSIDQELRILSGHYEVMYVGQPRAARLLRELLPKLTRILPASIAAEVTAAVHELSRGHEVRVPKRIAFDQMTADEWADYWKRAEVAIAERFGPEYLEPITLGGQAA